MDNVEIKEDSEFNSAIATLQRIDNIKKESHDSRFLNNNVKYFKTLEALYVELCVVMTPSEKEEHEKKYKYALSNILPQIIGGNGKVDDYLTLVQWDIELRQIEQSKKMNMPTKIDSRFTLASRGTRR